MVKKNEICKKTNKIAIITCIDSVNIGNRLQNYAVTELLSDKGFEVETLNYYAANDKSLKSKINSFIHCLLVKSGIFNSKFYINNIKHSPKMLLAKKFNDNNIKFNSKYIFKASKMKKYHEDYDFYCAGSDQVWNAALVQDNGFFFMNFAPSEKTFSLSASMGTAYIPDRYKDTFLDGFKHVGNISVREDDAKALIEKMTGRDSVVLLDPTILIEPSKWLDVAEKPEFDIPKKYIVTYFLGPLTESQKAYIDRYAKENDCGIIDMNGKYKNFVGPSEFVYLMSNAQFVFTDSFHGTAFSIIFSRKFVAFQRNNSYDMSSRIVTVLNKFNIINHFYNIENNELPDNFMKYLNDIRDSNYNIELALNAEKRKADKFLNKCLGTGECI